MKDIQTTLDFVPQFAPGALTASPTDGADVDLQDYDACMFAIHVGTWTDGTFTFEVEEADDDGSGSADTYAAVADAQLIGTEPVVSDGTNDDSVVYVGYRGSKRFVRLTLAVTGSPTTGAAVSAVAIRGHYRHQPTS